jgi:hypothetical protein
VLTRAVQGGEVGVGGLVESEITGGRGEAADHSRGRDVIEDNGPLSLIVC